MDSATKSLLLPSLFEAFMPACVIIRKISCDLFCKVEGSFSLREPNNFGTAIAVIGVHAKWNHSLQVGRRHVESEGSLTPGTPHDVEGNLR